MLDEIRANETVNINDDTMKKLKADFPSCFTSEGKFDLLKFKELLSDSIDITNEGYELNFLGKSYVTGVLMQGGKSVIGGQFRGATVADLVNLNKDGYERYINHALDVIKYRRK